MKQSNKEKEIGNKEKDSATPLVAESRKKNPNQFNAWPENYHS